MLRFARRSRRLALALAVTAAAGLGAGVLPVSASPSHTQITGTGSSWAANAVNQWISDVNQQGLQVVFTPTGSAQGRKDFGYKTTDFGVSDIAYQGTDPITGDQDTSQGRAYAYLPIVAGGTSFPYHLDIAGQQVKNLRLSGTTLAKIFTNKITYWDDTAIVADNNGKLALPHIPIIPVVHSEGSGSTYQFTAYLAHQYPSLWGPFNGGKAIATEYFPRQGRQQAQNGSDGIINFITSSAGEGSIGFDEYSYALLASYPVAKILNSAGYYAAPTQYNVAVALTQAKIDTADVNDPNKYLTQDLSNVYGYSDPRTYPLSSYSYMIIPIAGNDSKTSSTAQRQTIVDFLNYSICQGQKEMGPIGYSPLPYFLVSAGFQQIAKLKQADPAVDLTNRAPATCDNPTFDASGGNLNNNRLALIAPQPPACDKSTAGPCDATTGVVNSNPGGTSTKSGTAKGSKTTKSGDGTKTTTTGSVPSTGATGGTATASTSVQHGGAQQTASAAPSDASNGGQSAVVDPNTGVVAGGGDPSQAAQVQPKATTVAATQATPAFNTLMYVLCLVLIVLLLVAPIMVARALGRRSKGGA
jgi:phosphate ABC transporter phosphate-binding protein